MQRTHWASRRTNPSASSSARTWPPGRTSPTPTPAPVPSIVLELRVFQEVFSKAPAQTEAVGLTGIQRPPPLLVRSSSHRWVSMEISTLAVSPLTNALKFYSRATVQYLGECTGHTGSIHGIAFSAPSSPQVKCSCYGDGTIRAWDTRSFKEMPAFHVSS